MYVFRVIRCLNCVSGIVYAINWMKCVCNLLFVCMVLLVYLCVE